MQTIRTEQEGRVLTVLLDNPPRNFMTGQMVAELDELTRSLESDSSVGAVVITGAPDDIFITHYDVAEILAGTTGMGITVSPTAAGTSLRAVGALARVPGARATLERTPAAGPLALKRIHDLFLRMNRSDKVFIAAINGLALGGGCELALACDIRIMADGDGQIGLPEITLGIIPGAGGTQRLSRLLGPGRALEAMLEGRAFGPAEAAEIGIVHRSVPGERLADEARLTAERLARRSPAAVAALKRAVYEGAASDLPSGLHIERAQFLAAASSPAARAALAAYAEEVEAGGGASPWAGEDALERWRDGRAVNMTG